MTINWYMDKQNMDYPYNEIYCIVKEWSTDTDHNMHWSWKHYTKWKKPGIKDHVLYDSIYVHSPELVNL